jgi:two-component system LytT family sensor kinase
VTHDAPSTRARSRIRPWMLVSAIWIWPAVFSVVSRVLQVKLRGWDTPSVRDLLFAGGDWLIYALATPVIFWIVRRWPVVRPHPARRLAIHTAWALLFCIAWATGGKLLELILISVIDPAQLRATISAAGDALGHQVSVNVASWILTTLPFGAVVYTTVAGLAHALDYFEAARRRDVELAQLNEQLSSARFAALQAQVNPHFLFNTLNTIAVLVRDGDRGGAVRILEQLSEVLRSTLARHRANEVSLADELDLVQQYLAIEQARFSDRLRTSFDIPSELLSAAVPSFAIQHLVENAVRHGIARRTEAGLVHIAARRDGDTLEVSVSDDGPGIASAVSPPGHGLDNTRQRLRALHGDRASLVLSGEPGGGAVATLRVPWRVMP